MKRTAAALLVLLFASGCGAPPMLEERTVVLTPEDGGFGEVNLLLARGDAIHWNWTVESGPAIFFNVHSHPGGPGSPVVEHLRRTDALADTGEFTAQTPGTYSLLWETEGADRVTLHYRVTGDGALDAAHPSVP